jgi:molecular chaperone GrpE
MTRFDDPRDSSSTDPASTRSDETRPDPEKPSSENEARDEAYAELARQRDELQDQLRRTQAEFVNYQKRARAQAESDRQYATTPLAMDLLPVMDNLERAAEAARNANAPSILEGIEMVQKQLGDAFRKHGIELIDALGVPFDPNVHEALNQQPRADVPEGTVIVELGKGYRLHDRVLRPARVVISQRP